MHTLTPLSALTKEEALAHGGKVQQLVSLVRSGFEVPDGLVIPRAILNEHLKEAGLNSVVGVDPSAVARIIIDTPLKPGLSKALGEAVLTLGGVVAIRSSAADEDGPVSSKAGAYRTELGVRPDGVADAVKLVWASLFLEQERRGADSSVGISVLVQRMISPRASGVMFTINPLNGSWNELVIEAVRGLAEPLVSGEVSPHYYVIRRPRRLPRSVQRVRNRVGVRVLRRGTPPLQTHAVLSEEGGVEERPLSPALRRRSVLSERDLGRLTRLGLKVEQELGAPQDIEWAINSQGAVFILQSRPITAASSQGSAVPLYTRRFIGERWSEPPSVLGWSIVAPIIENLISYPEVSELHLGGGPAIKLHQGWPYINAQVFRHLVFKLPGAPPPRFMMEFFPREEALALSRRFGARPDFAVYAAIFATTFRQRRWERFSYNPWTNHKHWEQLEEELKQELPRLQTQCTRPEEALYELEHRLDLVTKYCSIHVTSLLFANLGDQLLEAAMYQWAPERAEEWLAQLATCPAGNKTMEVNAALVELAGALSEAAIAGLAEGNRPTNVDEKAALQQFLAAYGHRATSSWEIFSPRWVEDPSLLVPLLRLPSGESSSVRRRPDPAQFEVAWQKMKQEGPKGWRGLLLCELVTLTRKYLLLRENQRYWFDHLLFSVKSALLTLGEELVSRGELVCPRDVRFLTLAELREAVSGGRSGTAIAETIRPRRAASVVARTVDPPVFLEGEIPLGSSSTGRRLRGVGVSGGRGVGVARIIRTLQDVPALQPGEVIIARAMDPAWTPLFSTAGAMVLEMGSRLSHGAVVAREYGLPTVVNIEGICERVADGDRLVVDGSRGEVLLLG